MTHGIKHNPSIAPSALFDASSLSDEELQCCAADVRNLNPHWYQTLKPLLLKASDKSAAYLSLVDLMNAESKSSAEIQIVKVKKFFSDDAHITLSHYENEKHETGFRLIFSIVNNDPFFCSTHLKAGDNIDATFVFVETDDIYEASTTPLYEYLSRYKPPLFSSKEEFECLFPKIDLNKYTFEQFKNRLCIFRRLQNERPELLNEHFHLLLSAPYFHILPNRIHTQLDSVAAIAKMAHTHLIKTLNIIPNITGCERAKDNGVTPVSNGLFNWSNTCFMNAGLQLLAKNLQNTTVLNELKSGISLAAARDIIDSGYPKIDFNRRPSSLTTSAEKDQWYVEQTNTRQSELKHIAEKLCHLSESDLVAGKFTHLLPPSIFCYDYNHKFCAYFELRDAFINLCGALNLRDSQNAQTLSQYQQAFLETYANYAEKTGHKVAKDILNMKDHHALTYAAITQQDPQEFIADIIDIFGLTAHVDSHLLLDEYLLLYKKDDDTLLETSHALVPNPSSSIPIPTADGELSLANFMASFTTQERLRDSETYNWQAKLEKHKLSSDEVYTNKQIRLTSPSTQPPKILFTQLKLFGDDWEDNTKITKTIVVNDPSFSHPSMRTVDIGLETICDLIDSDHKVSIPIYLEGSDTPSHVTYTVDSILCHTGDSLSSGHYTVLRFEKNGDIHYCDDDIVVNWQDHAKAKGVTSSAKTLTQFCREKKLSGYMFSLSLDSP